MSSSSKGGDLRTVPWRSQSPNTNTSQKKPKGRDPGLAIQLQGCPSPSQESDPMHSTAAQNDKMAISKSHHGNGGSGEGPTPNDHRNLNARPRGHAMDREDSLSDQAEEDGVAYFPEQNLQELLVNYQPHSYHVQ
ncbi:hypothetical protein BKA82DRAFT_4017791 [Pisolithus tinctorius]|nr:hypothetical protein BKA82DRAFT_4017791 [Pisolithus tinctorius]